jgi:hypothetical protein
LACGFRREAGHIDLIGDGSESEARGPWHASVGLNAHDLN